MKTAAWFLGSLTFAVVVLLSSRIRGAPAELDFDDTRGKDLIENVVETYRRLPVYADTGQLSVVTRFRGKRRVRTVPVSLAFSRPNRLALRSATTEMICDGDRLSIA
jgi:hypothetical protein